ncbi:MAG: hypothetical protein V1721_04255 [Pseudomonadota bacterium]
MPFVIGIDGVGAAGKSILAEKLHAVLPGSIVIGMDDFCYPPSFKDGQWWGQGIADSYGFDWKRIRDQVMLPFSGGKKSIRYDKLNWNSYALERTLLAHDGDILIVEGMTSSRAELRGLLNLSIWLDSDDEGRIERIRKRDGDEMIGYWEREFLPGARQYVQKHAPEDHADIVFNVLDATESDFQELVRKIRASFQKTKRRLW